MPNRFSNQCLLIFKALKDRGHDASRTSTCVEMPPPDMPAALYAKAVDAIISGEPFMAQTELDGYGRVLYQTKDIWPNFISCVLVVNETYDRRASGARCRTWSTASPRAACGSKAGMDHRMEAARVRRRRSTTTRTRGSSASCSASRPTASPTATCGWRRRTSRRSSSWRSRPASSSKPIAFEEYADPRFSENTTGIRRLRLEGDLRVPRP